MADTESKKSIAASTVILYETSMLTKKMKNFSKT